MDTTCGFHVHASFERGHYTLHQLQNLAKAVAFWEPATARHCPLSRQDKVVSFCETNIRASGVRTLLETYGPLRGMAKVFETIDQLNRDELVAYICPNKFHSWNFLPSKTDGSGSIEFRRPPGVVTSKKAKHWVAFTLAFIWMATKFKSQDYVSNYQDPEYFEGTYFPDFRRQLLRSAKQLGELEHLDARLQQEDNPGRLHITRMSEDSFNWLREKDARYQWSINA